MNDDERPDQILAAEYAVGLLEGEELLSFRARMAREPELEAEVAFWETRLAPLLDEVSGGRPDRAVWDRIAAEIGSGGRGGEVFRMRRQITFWQRAAAAASVAAVAAMALVLFQLSPATPPETPEAEAPLVASIPIGDTPLRLGVTFLPDREEMLVSASGLTADGVHDHELWLVPAAGDPLSLGVVAPGEERRMPIDPAMAELIGDGSRMVLTREPIGGKPPAAQAGPVVAEGSFSTT